MSKAPLTIYAAFAVVTMTPVLPAYGSDTDIDALVHQLRTLSTPLSGPTAGKESEEDRRRRQLYEQLHERGEQSVPALARALSDHDVHLRRNVTLVLGVLGGSWWHFAHDPEPIDISAALPALMKALHDPDEEVRNWAAQDIGDIGLDAGRAVPALIELMHADPAAKISVCAALHDMGPVATQALPDLRPLLASSDPDTRKAAQWAIRGIEGTRTLPQE